MYIEKATHGLLNVTPQEKKVLIAEIDKMLKDIGKDLGQQEVAQVTTILEDTYPMVYYHSAYALGFGMKESISFSILKKEYIDSAVNNPIDGKVFSDRIWTNKANLVDKVKQGIIDSMNGDIHLDKLARNIKQEFNTTAYESKRLVMNESAKVQSQAIDDIGRNIGVEKQMYTATLDSKTSTFCQKHDGHVYDINDPKKPRIPEDSHVGCRSCYINMPWDDWQPQKRRDNETGKNIEYMTYEEWIKSKGINDSTAN